MRHITSRVRALALASLLLLTNCSKVESWISDSKKEVVKGDRVSVGKLLSPLDVDNSYSAVKVHIPSELNVDAVRLSSGVNMTEFPNIQLAEELNITRSFGFHITTGFVHVTPPIFFDGKMVILEPTGSIVAFDILSGKKLWKNVSLKKRTNSGLLNFSSPFYYGGLAQYGDLIYATSGLNTVIAINAADGRLIWSRNIPGTSRSVPVLGGGMLFIQTADNSVFALDPNSGNIIWTYYGIAGDVGAVGASVPIYFDGAVIVQYNTADIVAIDTSNGQEIWALAARQGMERLAVGKHFHGALYVPILDRDTLISYDDDGTLSAIDLNNGKRIWTRDVAIARPFWICGELVLAINEFDDLIAVNKFDGRIKWKTALKQFDTKKGKDIATWSGPTVADGKALLVSSRGQLLSFDINNGSLISTKDVVEGVLAAPIVVNKKLYLISGSGKVVEYS